MTELSFTYADLAAIGLAIKHIIIITTVKYIVISFFILLISKVLVQEARLYGLCSYFGD